jgi:general secretion pathway protein L
VTAMGYISMRSIRRTSLIWLRALQRVWTRFAQWWLTEFLGLFPRRAAIWLMDRGQKRATLGLGHDPIILEIQEGNHRPPISIEVARTKYSPEVLDEFLRINKLSRRDADVGLRIPTDMIFPRRLVFPVEAAGSLPAVAAQDLALNTPFQLAHVYHDLSAVKDGSRIIAHQWVVPRSTLADALEPLGEDISSFRFVEAVPPDQKQPRPYIDLAGDQVASKSVVRMLALGLLTFALSLVIAAGIVRYSRQETLLVQLAIELPVAAANARAVQAALESSNAKHAVIAEIRSNKLRKPGLLEVWEEISERLPQDSWLTELRVSELSDNTGSQVTLTGYSPAAAQLVATLHKSSLLADVNLAAPIALDTMEQRERFSLRATLRTFEQKARKP